MVLCCRIPSDEIISTPNCIPNLSLLSRVVLTYQFYISLSIFRVRLFSSDRFPTPINPTGHPHIEKLLESSLILHIHITVKVLMYSLFDFRFDGQDDSRWTRMVLEGAGRARVDPRVSRRIMIRIDSYGRVRNV